MSPVFARARVRAALRRRLVRSAMVAAVITAVPSTAVHAQLLYDGTTFLHGLGSDSSIWTRPYATTGSRTPPQYLGQQVNLKAVRTPYLNAGAPGRPDSTQGLPYSGQRDNLTQYLTAAGGLHVLVGHSLGSLVARGTFGQVGPGRVAGILAIAGPHQGVLIADSASVARKYITSLEDAIHDAQEGARAVAKLLTILSVTTMNPIPLVVGQQYQKGSQSEVSFPTGPLEGIDSLKALPDLRTNSDVIRDLNIYTGDAIVPRANIRGSIPHGHALLRLAAATGVTSFEDLKKAKDEGLSGLRKCRNMGDFTFNLGDPGNRCQRAARMLDALDRRWAGWVNGTEYGLVRRWPMPTYGQVPRLVPFDGIVPNERSNFPGGALVRDVTVSMASHQDIYKLPEPLNETARGMRDMGMLPGPPTVSIAGPSQFSSSGTLTWSASASGGTGTYSYQWRYRPLNSLTWTTFGGTGPSASRSVSSTTPSFVVRVTVTSGGATSSAERTVSNTYDGGGTGCGTQRVCY